MTAPLLEVSGLQVRTGDRTLLTDVTFRLGAGERLGLIGESGSGKSLTALALTGLLPPGVDATGSVRLAGVDGDLLGLRERAWTGIRGDDISMVFQEPMSALNPLMRVGNQVGEVLALHGHTGRRHRRDRVLELLASVHLPDPARIARSYPHELSGGQRQRVLIAIAMANRPRLLICDEPTTALDVTVQAQILGLVDEMVRDHDTALLLISHDLAVVSQLCERVLVMKDGHLVESGPVSDVFRAPAHPYTRSLLDASRLGRAESADTAHASDAPVFNPQPEPLIAVRGLHRTHPGPRESLRRAGTPVAALADVSFDVAAGQRFGIVGESGSGKSTLIRLLCALDTPTSGSVRVDGREIVGARERDLTDLRRDVSIVFQDPLGSLDPRMRVRDIVAEPLGGHAAADGVTVRDRVAGVLADVGLGADAADRYPHQFSGGQRQRISIARALVTRPRILVADEPVSALDVSVRAQVLDLLARLVDEHDLTLVLVSHDLAVIRHVCDVVAVMHRGRIVECGPTEEVYERPLQPYTRTLIGSAPTLRVSDG